MDLLRHVLTLDELTSDIIKTMYRYWQQKRGDKIYPLIIDICLDDVPAVKPYASIIDLHYPPYRMLYRYMGEQIVYFYGRDISDQWVDEVLEGEILEDFEISHRMAVTDSEPLLAKSRWYGMHAVSDKTFEWGMFPISQNGVAVTGIIFVEDYRHLNKAELPLFLDSPS